MKVGWLVDWTEATGGAELTQAEQRAAAPTGIEIIDCPPGEVVPDLDRYVIQNCVRYSLEDLRALTDRPAVKMWHDVGPWLKEDVRGWLDWHARPICCSPIQVEHMGFPSETICIPPPLDLKRFEDAAARVNGERAGAVSVGSWRNHGKAPHKAAEWAADNGGIDFYGEGAWAPAGSKPVPYEHMPTLLASYETFVFLPIVLEPFGRLVAEAWAAGCKVVTNNLVGARWWIENQPEALDTAADDFWRTVLA